MHEFFRKFANKTSALMGSAWAFIAALGLLFAWAASGPLFHFSETWQLVINTSTTIITFLMVFLIQNSQNRDNRAMHLKLDEMLRSLKAARKSLIDLESLPDEALQQLQAEFQQLRDADVPLVEDDLSADT